MSESQSFRGTPRAGGARDRRVAGLVAGLLVVFLGLAIAKPWGVPAVPPATPGPSPAAARVPAASILTTGPAGPSTGPAVPSPAATATPRPLPVGFTTPAPPPATATWTGLRWRRLAPDDPLTLVTSVLRWRGGYVATGWVDPLDALATALWTSRDGARWEHLPSGTGTTLWPGAVVLGLVEVPSGLVAVTEQAGDDCPVCAPVVPPIVSWTSADGRTWTPHALPADWLAAPTGSALRVAGGPAGILVASGGPAAHVATSADGALWRYLPADALPSTFILNDLQGTTEGYVAAGRWLGDTGGQAASLWSPDGRGWSRTPALLPTSPNLAPGAGSTVDTLIAARDGLIAIGHGVVTPGAGLWWQSGDGRHWRSLQGYPPLGAWSPSGEAVRSGPHGALAEDGRRMVAVRGGPDPVAWSSADGRSWRQVPMAGDIPSAQATQAILLPGGLLLRDGSTTWFGEATAG